MKSSIKSHRDQASHYPEQVKLHKEECGDQNSQGNGKKQEIEVVVGLGLGKNVMIFPKNVHQKLLGYVKSQPDPDPDWDPIRGMIMRTADIQTLDKQNRLRIPHLLAQRFGLTGDVVVSGIGDRLELVPKEQWDDGLDEYMHGFDDRFRRAQSKAKEQG